MPRKKPRKDPTSMRGLRDGRLSYGTPVSVDGRTVIPVTRVRMSRFAKGGEGSAVESAPLGYIEVTAEGSAFHPIDDHTRDGRFLRTAAAAATTLVGAVAGARALRASRRTQRLLPSGRHRLHR